MVDTETLALGAAVAAAGVALSGSDSGDGRNRTTGGSGDVIDLSGAFPDLPALDAPDVSVPAVGPGAGTGGFGELDLSGLGPTVETTPSGGSDDTAGVVETVTDGITETADTITDPADTVTDTAETLETVGTVTDAVTETVTGTDTDTGTPANVTTNRPTGNTADGFDLQDTAGQNLGLSDVPALIGEAGAAAGSALGDAGEFVSENPIATAGAAAGVAAAPFTGGASVPVGLAGAGAAGEVGADLATGQYGDPSEAVADAGDTVAGVADAAAGSVDESVGRQFDDTPGGGFADPVTSAVDSAVSAANNAVDNSANRTEAGAAETVNEVTSAAGDAVDSVTNAVGFGDSDSNRTRTVSTGYDPEGSGGQTGSARGQDTDEEKETNENRAVPTGSNSPIGRATSLEELQRV